MNLLYSTKGASNTEIANWRFQ